MAPSRWSLTARIATSRPPQQSRRLLASMLLAIGVAAHVPDALAAAIGMAALTSVLCCLWLRKRWAAVGLAAIPALGVPIPLRAGGLALTGLGSLLLVVAGLTVMQLVEQMLLAQESALRHVGAREELARRSETERTTLADQLTLASTLDPLTGVLHRVALLSHVDAAIASGAPVGLLVLSLRDFRQVNDQYGAKLGDELLAAVADRLRTSARGSDLVGRLGGDEFGIVLRGLHPEPAQQVGNRLLALLDPPFAVGPHTLAVRGRAGLALHAADVACTGLDLLRQACAAAASAGAAAAITQVFDPSRDAAVEERLVLEREMSAGLARGEFFLLYQPKVCSRSGRMLSVEALVRWQHPTRGLIPPDAFIAAAERTGLIVPLGLQVLSMACAQLRQWSTRLPDLTIAVNVSARQLVEPDFVARVREIVYGAGIDPHAITLELTESLLVEDEDAAIAVLWRLRSLGLHMSLDDFGTGYSSLARLGTLPLNEMKIDRSLVNRLGVQPNDSTILVTAAIAMGHGLGLAVVAEGVEDEQQSAFLTSVGCDVLQGYLLGRPQTADDIAGSIGQQLLAPTPSLAVAPA